MLQTEEIGKSITVEIPQQLNEKLEKVCMAQGQQPSALMTEALHRFFGKPIPKEERFFPRRKWAIPRNTFIAFGLVHEEWLKLKAWKRKGHRIVIDVMSENEVLILNETKLDKRHVGKKKKQNLSPKETA